jgi:hypothetical protein
MLRILKKYILISFLIIGVLGFSGCTFIEGIEKKLGFTNEYFDNLNLNEIEEISIQSTRDLGFKFIVTESRAIEEMYNLLLKSKVSENKSSLEPDYKFKIDLSKIFIISLLTLVCIYRHYICSKSYRVLIQIIFN